MWSNRGCREIEPLLWSYAAHTLPEYECEVVKSHLADCPACRSQWEEYRVTVALTTTFRDTTVPESATNWNDLLARMEARTAAGSQRAPHPRFAFPVWSGAMLAAAAVAAFFLLPRSAPHRAPFRESAQAPVVVQTPVDTPRVDEETRIDQDTKSQNRNSIDKESRIKPEKRIAATKTQVRPKQKVSFLRLLRKKSRPRLASASSPTRVIRKQPDWRIARVQPRQESTPETLLPPEPQEIVAQKTYPVDGERPSARDLPQNFVAYMVPLDGNIPMQRDFVIDNIPVPASGPLTASAPEARELQAW